MKSIRLGTILENAARLAGRDANRMGVPDNWKVLAAMSLGAGITRIIAEKFPMMTRIEFRRYRPEWSDSVTYRVGNEVWLNGEYWRKVVAGHGAPGDSDTWKLLDMTEVSAFIAWDQPWENTVIHRAGVDSTRFAYAADPKYCPEATPIKCAKVTAFGIELEAPAPKGVFCQFVPEYPSVSFDEWSSGRSYEPGDVAYVTAEKDVFVCLHPVRQGGMSPQTDQDNWIVFRMPGEFEAYLTRLVSCDFLTQDQGKLQSMGYADAEFNRLCDLYHAGNGETRMRVGRFM